MGILGGVVAIAAIAAAGTWLAGAAAKARLAKQNPPPGRMVDVGGYSLHLESLGQGSPTVVMDAGLNDFSVQWARVHPAIAAVTRTVVYDRSGLGWSEAGPRPRTSTVMVDELHELLARAGVSAPYVLVGHSFGALNMRLFARRYPGAVMGMVLVDPAHEEQTIRIAALRPAAEKAVAQFRALGRLSALGLMALRPGSIPSRGLPERALAGYRAVVAATGYFQAAAAETAGLEESLAQARASHPASLGDLPLVVVSRGLAEPFAGLSDAENAANEREWRSMQAELAALSSKGMQVTAERSGHYIQLEQPEIVVDAILRVLREVRTAGERP